MKSADDSVCFHKSEVLDAREKAAAAPIATTIKAVFVLNESQCHRHLIRNIENDVLAVVQSRKNARARTRMLQRHLGILRQLTHGEDLTAHIHTTRFLYMRYLVWCSKSFRHHVQSRRHQFPTSGRREQEVSKMW